MAKNDPVTVAQLGEFDALLDARSPAEFADDHVPAATNCPVLSNDERIRVGTLYQQVSPFEARKIGAVLVARNIAQHIETLMLEQPKSWRPLVYCWRGGQRSGAFCHILREIGWDAQRLHGGYKSWRQHVLAGLQTLPPTLHYRVISGPTGSGKSRLLERLAVQGAQVLHLEALARHRGSVLGLLPEDTQPSQRGFETALFMALSAFDAARPVFVEAESRLIGKLRVPDALLHALRAAPCIALDVPAAARRDFLLGAYAYLLRNPEFLRQQLQRLKEIQGSNVISRWNALIAANDYATLVDELLACHYDPLYHRAQHGHFAQLRQAHRYALAEISDATLDALAARLMLQAH